MKTTRVCILALLGTGALACGGAVTEPDSGHSSGVDGGHVLIDGGNADEDAGPPCPLGQTFCDGVCVTLETDRSNCGDCGRRCAMGEVCSGSMCRIDCSAPTVPCTDATSAMYCADLSNDEANCGSCGRPCDLGWSCLGGDCQLVCPTGQDACGTECANLSTDPHHCGACPINCDRDHAVGVCRSGACAIACEIGYGDCDHITDTGCEENTSISIANCGSCGHSCMLPHVMDASCTDGNCGIVACAPGFEDCNGLVVDGCEADLNSLTDCGTCGHRCRTTDSCFPGGLCLVDPSAGTFSVPVCGASSPTIPGIAVDVLTQEIYVLRTETGGTLPFNGCVAVSNDGGRTFSMRRGSMAPGWGGTWNPSRAFSAAGGYLAHCDGSYIQYSWDGGANWLWRNAQGGVAMPDGVLQVMSASTIVRITPTGADVTATLTPAPNTIRRVWWDQETSRAWISATRVGGGVDLYHSEDGGRTWTLLGLVDAWDSFTATGNRIYGTSGGAFWTATTSVTTATPITCPTGCTVYASGTFYHANISPSFGESIVFTAIQSGMRGLARLQGGGTLDFRTATLDTTPGYPSIAAFPVSHAAAYVSTPSSIGIIRWDP